MKRRLSVCFLACCPFMMGQAFKHQRLTPICELIFSDRPLKKRQVVFTFGTLVGSSRHGLNLVNGRAPYCSKGNPEVNMRASIMLHMRDPEEPSAENPKASKIIRSFVNQDREVKVLGKVIELECAGGICNFELLVLDMDVRK